MARSGDRIYDYDNNLNYLAEIKDPLTKEAAYWFTPEIAHVFVHRVLWLREALTMLEMMALLGEINPEIMRNETAAMERWREVFFSVWDGDWTVDLPPHPYSASAYRAEHRSLVSKLLDHLWHMANDWPDGQPYKTPVLPPPLLLEGRLPYFSRVTFIGADGNETFETGQYLGTFFYMITRTIVFVFSEENRGRERVIDLYDLAEVWVAIDVMGFLCEKYQVSPGLRVATIQRWLDINTALWIEYYKSDWGETIDVETLIEKDDLYPTVVSVFVHLMNLARQHAGRGL